MKRKQTKKNMKGFTARSSVKRRAQDQRRRDLVRAVENTGVGYTPAALSAAVSGGRLSRGQGNKKSSRMAENRAEVRTRGEFCGSRGGFGFVRPEEGGRDIFIPEGKLGGAIDGDTVEIAYKSYTDRDGRERTEGRVLSIIREGRDIIIGTLVCERSYMRGRRRIPERWVVLPDDGRIPFSPTVVPPLDGFHGDKVAVRLLRGESFSYEVRGEVVRVLGDGESREANYAAVLLECGIEEEFDSEELDEAQRRAALPVVAEGRRDLRDELIMTIDGEGAKDLDDAVSLRRVRGGWRLSVHIADVSHYVAERTPLDRLAMRRGTSVYFADKVVPMLPPALSNGVCSLNAGEDKYAISAIIGLDEYGAIRSLELCPSVIRSRVRGVYSEVNALLSGEASPEVERKYSSVVPMLRRMEELYRILERRSHARGALNMEIPDVAVALDAEGHPTDIYPVLRGVGERMIEQFMLTANEAVAAELYRRGIPCVYRIHERPSEDKMTELRGFCHNLGLDTRAVREPVSGAGLSSLLAEAEERGVLPQVSYATLRSLAKAKYSEIRVGHFGLGLEDYCHFTSPIRRLSDLATHRIIKRVIFEGKRAEQYVSYARRAAAAASEGEERAVRAEREITDLYRTVYMADKIGESFEGAVSSVTPHGLYVMLSNTCEGLVPISELPGLFVYDERGMLLRSGNMLLRVGDRVSIKLEEADIGRRRLRFSLLL